MMELKYKKVLLKLSGEVFKGSNDYGFDATVLTRLANEVSELVEMGCSVGIVVGGGNIWRYRDFKDLPLDRNTSDSMGMLATVMNAAAFEVVLKSIDVDATAFSCFSVPKLALDYSPKLAKQYMDSGEVCVFGGGTGGPFFTTDSAAALRALEMKCDVLLKATNVDYVYDKDPSKNKDAKPYKSLTYNEILEKNLRVMDQTCASLCRDGDMNMIVFNLEKPGNMKKAVQGEEIGTFISNAEII